MSRAAKIWTGGVAAVVLVGALTGAAWKVVSDRAAAAEESRARAAHLQESQNVEAVRGDLRAVGGAQERHFNKHGEYADSVLALGSEHSSLSEGVRLDVVEATATEYCLEATHKDPRWTFYLASDEEHVERGQCR